MTTTDPTDEGPADQSGAELEWPERGRTLAVWLDHGRAAWLRLGTANQWQTAADSPLRLDDLTLHAGAKSSNSGWFARLTMLGAADMLRGVAALYASTPVVPLSRAHFPVVRSVQEHLGQVIWLLEPGIQITPIKNAPPITTHEVDAALFRARSLRAALLHWQFASDA